MERYRSGKYEAAIPGLAKAAKLDLHDAGSRFFLGICHLLSGQTDAAIAALQQVLTLGDTPYREEAHFYLAELFAAERRPKEARREYERAFSQLNRAGERSYRARKLEANLLFRLGRREESRRPVVST